VTQQVTNPGFPQVEFAAHLTTALRHSSGRLPLATAAFATPATQWTYCP